MSCMNLYYMSLLKEPMGVFQGRSLSLVSFDLYVYLRKNNDPCAELHTQAILNHDPI